MPRLVDLARKAERLVLPTGGPALATALLTESRQRAERALRDYIAKAEREGATVARLTLDERLAAGAYAIGGTS